MSHVRFHALVHTLSHTLLQYMRKLRPVAAPLASGTQPRVAEREDTKAPGTRTGLRSAPIVLGGYLGRWVAVRDSCAPQSAARWTGRGWAKGRVITFAVVACSYVVSHVHEDDFPKCQELWPPPFLSPLHLSPKRKPHGRMLSATAIGKKSPWVALQHHGSNRGPPPLPSLCHYAPGFKVVDEIRSVCIHMYKYVLCTSMYV